MITAKATTRRAAALAAVAVLMLPVAPGKAGAVEPVEVRVSGDTLTAKLQVPGGFAAELTVTFEDVVGLNAHTLAIDAVAVNPLDPTLLARLGADVGGIPAAFPVLVHIEPDPGRGLMFSGIVSVELYTHDLEFVPGSALRLYSAPQGGAFRDITVSHGAGSYRSGGTKGNFSEFIIALDALTPLAAASDKLAALRAMLEGYSTTLDAAIYDELSGLLAAAESAFTNGSLVAALTYVEAFADTVRNYGAAIPNVWSAARDLENVSGRLRAAAGTLRFSLTLAINTL